MSGIMKTLGPILVILLLLAGAFTGGYKYREHTQPVRIDTVTSVQYDTVLSEPPAPVVVTVPAVPETIMTDSVVYVDSVVTDTIPAGTQVATFDSAFADLQLRVTHYYGSVNRWQVEYQITTVDTTIVQTTTNTITKEVPPPFFRDPNTWKGAGAVAGLVLIFTVL